MSGIIKVLLEDIIRERENKHIKRKTEKIIRERERQADRPLTQEDFVKSVFSEEWNDKSMSEDVHRNIGIKNEEPDTMEEWEKLGYFDCGIDETEKEEQLLAAYERTLQFCKKKEMEITVKNQMFFVKTNAGRWYFDPLAERRSLYHENYDVTRNSPGKYHLQYTKEESLESTLSYIEMHDRKKEKIRQEKEKKYFKNTLT